MDSVHIGSVLVHDLQFTVPASDPASLAEAIEREGILADALGNYTASLDGGTLAVGYTGPLLSDALVESVRAGMARDAGVEPGDVTLGPRSTSGEGVDLSREPAQDSGEAGALGTSGRALSPKVTFGPICGYLVGGSLEVRRDSQVQRVPDHAPVVALAARCRTDTGNGTGAP